MRKKPSILGTLITAAILFVVGLMVYQHLTKPMAEEAKASKEWPTAQGVITHSELNKSQDSDGNNLFSANVKYTYVVNGEEYSNGNIATVNGSTSLKSNVIKKVKKYTKGKNVTVYYDPEFPNIAVLEPGTNFWISILLKIPLLLCAISVLMVLSLFKRILFRR